MIYNSRRPSRSRSGYPAEEAGYIPKIFTPESANKNIKTSEKKQDTLLKITLRKYKIPRKPLRIFVVL
jgi:hypothetical protein